jgi:NAD+ diphosphatase
MLKTPFEAFKHCLLCGSQAKVIESNILKCTQCNYKHYINSAPASGILLKNRDDKYLLTKRGIEPFKGEWDVAGGFIGINESFEEASLRELEEELHISAPIDKIIGSAYLIYPYQNIELPVLAIVALAQIGEQTIQIDDDVADIAYFTLEQLSEITMPYKNLESLIRNFAIQELKIKNHQTI